MPHEDGGRVTLGGLKSFRDQERERQLRQKGPNPHERGDNPQATGNVRGMKQDFGGYDDPRLHRGYGFNLGEYSPAPSIAASRAIDPRTTDATRSNIWRNNAINQFNQGFQNPQAFFGRERDAFTGFNPAFGATFQPQPIDPGAEQGFDTSFGAFGPTGRFTGGLPGSGPEDTGFAPGDPGFGFGAPAAGEVEVEVPVEVVDDGSGEVVPPPEVDGVMGPEPSNISMMVNALGNEIDKDFVSNWLRTVITQYDEVGMVGTDENGDIVVFDRNSNEISRLQRNFAMGDSSESLNAQFELERLNLDRELQNANNAFRQIELAQQARIADLQKDMAQDRIDADVQIAQGNWDNAIEIQDRVDERERLQRQLTRDLEDARLELQNRTVDIDRARLDMERQRFAMEVAVSPANLITLSNMSRGFPAGQGELPGGFQRIGQAGAFGADFGTGPFRAAPTVARPEVGGPPVQAEPAPAEADAAPSAPIGGFPEGDPNPAGGTVEQPPIPLPPGLAAAFAGELPNASFGAPQLPPGSVPPLSDQQLAQLTPLEKLFYQDLIRLQGQRPEDFEAIRGAATPFQIPTSQVA